MADLSPNAHILHALSNQSLPWWKALAELVDNAINAGATRVAIETHGRTISISDDGQGAKDVLSFFRLGDHRKQRASGNGMYGIGAKDAWLSCADEMRVESIYRGMSSKLSVSLQELIATNWQASDPHCEASDKPSGTTISLPLRSGKSIPKADAYDELSFVFTPALLSGIQVVRISGSKREPLKPHTMPPRDDVVQSEFDIDGKSVKIDIGILPENVRMLRGPFWLIHMHRIVQKTSRGVGQYSQRRMAGTITLGNEWKLAKNKDELAENEDRLQDAIFTRIEHVLKRAEELSETIESASLRSELQGSLNKIIGDANRKQREKRGKGSSVGSVGPTNSGRKRRRASQVTDASGSVEGGGINESGRRNGFILDWCDLEPNMIGMFERGSRRVSLNIANPFIAMLKVESNRDAMLSCALGLIADDACRHDENGKKLLTFAFSDFTTAFGGLVTEFRRELNDGNKAAC